MNTNILQWILWIHWSEVTNFTLSNPFQDRRSTSEYPLHWLLETRVLHISQRDPAAQRIAEHSIQNGSPHLQRRCCEAISVILFISLVL